MKISYKTINIKIFSLMLFSVFCITYYVRASVLGNLADMNVLFIVSTIILMWANRKRTSAIEVLYITFIGIYIFIIDNILCNNSISAVVRNLSMNIFPLYILSIKLPKKYVKLIYTQSLKFFNIAIIIMFVIGIIDPFINYNIMKLYGSTFAPGLLRWINSNATSHRYASYMGHALFTKQIFLMFYLLNYVYCKKYKSYVLNKDYVMIISLVGILLTGSKTGALLIIICITFNSLIEKNFSKKLMPFVAFCGAYMLGFFNTLFNRLENETLTTGRAEASDYIDGLQIIKVRLLSGYGEYVDRVIQNISNGSLATAYLEYPLKTLALKYGLLCTSLIVLYVFIKPVIKFIKDKEYYILFAFIIQAIDVNTYNGLVLKADNMILFVIFTALLMAISGDKNIDTAERIVEK